jgi:hypothetical protein
MKIGFTREESRGLESGRVVIWSEWGSCILNGFLKKIKENKKF